MTTESSQTPLTLPAPLYTAPEVAAVLNLSTKSVYRYAKDGLIPSILIGGAVRFDPADVAAFLREHRQGSEGRA